MTAPKRVVLTGGGTGGHIYPALAVAERLKTRFEVAYIGRRGGMEERVVPPKGIPFYGINAAGLARKGVSRQLSAVVSAAAGTLEAWRILARLRPQAVLGTGGYVAGPVGLAARLLGIPLTILEPDARLGVANRIMARWARLVFLGFPGAIDSLPPSIRLKAVGTGIPVRDEVGRISREEGLRVFGLRPGRSTVLVFGGSLGALSLNRAMEDLIARRVLEDVQFIWGTGRRYAEADAGPLPDHVRRFAYIDDLPSALAAADIAVTRAGAVTVAELSATGTPSILVPSPYVSDDQQFKNAREAERAGGAVVLTDAQLEEGRLAPEVRELLGDAARLERMGEAMRRVVPPGAAERIAREIRALVWSGRPRR